MNITVDNIEMFIEIGQIGLHSAPVNATLWLHSGLNESKEVIELILCCCISWLWWTPLNFWNSSWHCIRCAWSVRFGTGLKCYGWSYQCILFYVPAYLHLNDFFLSEPWSASSLLTLFLYLIQKRTFFVHQSTVSKHALKEWQSTNPRPVYPPPDSWQNGCCFLYARFPRPLSCATCISFCHLLLIINSKQIFAHRHFWWT